MESRDIPSTLKVSEGLGKLERLDNNSLLLLIVSDLGISGKGKVLSQWVTIKAVVGHDSPQVGVATEEDTKQIPYLTLVPVCAIVEPGDGRDRSGLIGVRLYADARVVADGEEVVDDFEALAAGGVVDGGDVADLGKLGGSVVLEKVEDGEDALRGNVNCELVLPDGESVVGWNSQRKVAKAVFSRE